jgi:hypothetical protein
MVDTTNDQVRSNCPESSKNSVTIWQQNVNRSRTCQHNLISSAALARRGIDIVALQEPAVNSFSMTIASKDWILVYPTTHTSNPAKTCSLILVRSNILTEHWKQINFPSGDITIINISGPWGEATIYNIYNDCDKNNTIHQIEAFAQLQTPVTNPNNTAREKAQMTMWLGDFNRHHPHWDDPADTRLFTRKAIHDTEVLISALAELGLDLALPQGIPTHLHNVTKRWTRLDQVFILEDHMNTIVTCKALSNTPGINTDHLPILTTLDLDLARAPSNLLKNFRNINWEEFEKTLSVTLR